MAAHGMTDNSRPGAGSSLQFRSLMFALVGMLGVLLLLFVAMSLFGRANDGEPVAGLDIRLALPRASVASRRAGSEAPQPGGQARPISSQPLLPSAGATTRGAPPSPGGPGASTPPGKIDKPIYAGKILIADPALIEQTPQGPLPRIADDGRTPMAAYAPVANVDARPKVSLVVTGLGVDARITAAAIKSLPPQITLAFVPYADDVQQWISQARAAGHEVLLEVPMEPYDFPDSDPGPHTLTVTASEESNIERLTWALTRATGYSGVVNLLGGRFMAAPDSLAPVMTFLARRGLLFLDNDRQAHSAAPDIARQINAPYVGGTLAIDDIQTATDIDARLSELEAFARAGGVAVGIGFVYPVTIDRAAQWASGLSGRGFVLVPPSVIVARSK
jgi:polysaccharide deacetylase 2 family uncharacterized protein YibQ